MYKCGDKILHPLHGVGVVESIQDQEVLGMTKKYYIVNLTMKKMTVMIPMESCEEIGVRKIIKTQVIDEVLDGLKCKKTSDMPSNWNRRYKHNLDKIRTGDVHEVADVLRNLYIKDKRKGLSMGEKKMMDNAMNLIVGEIVCAKKMTMEKAKACVMEALH
ncbi:MAG TPA: CarD family transcriptional regulator [bacterium]|nr:CarD family transcriptional regulator [bacterium]